MTETITIVLTPVVLAGFCTVADVKAFLQIDIAVGDATTACERAILEATEAIRTYCRQFLTLVEDETETFDVGDAVRSLYLPELPVVAVTSVVENGVALVAGADEDYQLGNHGILYRVGAYWYPGIQMVTVTNDHGYATIPQGIIDVCTRAASRAYQAGLRSDEAAGVPGLQALGLGDYSVTFGAEGGGGIGEGVLGASAARMLLLSEKDMLDRYRQVGL